MKNTPPRQINTAPSRKERWLLIALGAVTVFLFLFRLGTQAFIDYDEATYARVAKETVASGQILPLMLNDEPWVDKPPLYFWLSIASAKLFGFNEFALRFPAAFLGIVSVFLTFLITRLLTKNLLTAAVAAGILLTTGIFLEAGRQVRLDVPVTAFLLLAFFAFLRGRENPRWYLLVGIATALGFLTKSVVIFLIIPLLVLYAVFYRRFEWIKNGFFYTGIVGGILMLVPWVWHEYARNSEMFIDTYIGSHLTQRVTERLIGGDVSNVTYAKHLLRFTEPWCLVFASSFIYLLIKILKNFRETLTAYRDAIFTMTTALIMFIPFAVAKTKLLYYLTPIYPIAAITCAIVLTYLIQSNREKIEVMGIKVLFGILFSVGTISAVYTGFHIDNAVGATTLSEEERAVGHAIASYPKEIPVYAVQHLFWDTINYYSGKKVTLFPTTDNVPETFLVIVPTTSLIYQPPQEITELPAKHEIYKGAILSVLSVP